MFRRQRLMIIFLVHVGFAISKVDEQEAKRVFAYLEEIDELEELQSEKENFQND